MKLRDYQEGQLEAISRALLELNVNRQLVKAPTGTGKTVTFAELLKWPALRTWLEQFPSNERRMLVMAHREELLEQAAEKIRRANPGLLVAIEQAGRRASVHVDVVVASIPTLASMKFRRLERLLRRMRFRIVVVDEAHHSAARTYRQVLSRLSFLPPMASDDDFTALDLERAVESDVQALEQALKGWDRIAPRDQLLIGVTATPNRSDNVGLSCVYQSIVYSYALKDAIRDGWLVPITTWAVETSTSLDGVKTRGDEFVTRDLSRAVNTSDRNLKAFAAWKEQAEGRPTIVFGVDVAHAHALAEVWTDGGYRAAVVSGKTPKDERRRTLLAVAEGRLDAVMNCMVLTEGTDLPIVSCIVHAAPTKSATLYEQKTGRGLRPVPGDPVGPERAAFKGILAKPDCIVIDVVDVSRKHSLQTAPVLYGLPPGLMAKKPKALEDLEAELLKLEDAFPGFDLAGQFEENVHLSLEDLRAKAEYVDVWKVEQQAALGYGRALSWTKVGDAFELEYPWTDAAGMSGWERVRLSMDTLSRWEITLMFKERVPKEERRTPARRQQTIANGLLSSDDAAGVAEAFILTHRRKAQSHTRKDAAWRLRPVSQPQLDLLARMRIVHAAGLTAGEASDLINSKTLRRR